MQHSFDQLSYVILENGCGTNPQYREAYVEAYKLWRAVWKETLLQLDGNDEIYSDSFTRQWRVGCLFFNNECVALSFFQKTDFSLAVATDDSYFQAWARPDLDFLCQKGSDVLIGSNITVKTDYRGIAFDGVLLKDIILNFCIRMLLESSCTVMTGTMRSNKGMDKLALRLGATLIRDRVIFHGVEVALVGFFPEICRQALYSNENFPFLMNRLWKSRIYLDEKSANIQQQKKTA